MGLLEKQNHCATRQSAKKWATIGGIGGGLFGFVKWYLSDMPFGFVFLVIPWTIVFGALSAWAIEWQLPCECEESEASAT
jgi:hypothetical protein